MIRLRLALLPLMFASNALAQRESNVSGNDMLPGCRAVVARDVKRSVKAGECIGAVQTVGMMAGLMEAPFKLCVPKGVTNEQVIRVVIKFVEANPERAHEPFAYLAHEAMSKAWPCKK